MMRKILAPAFYSCVAASCILTIFSLAPSLSRAQCGDPGNPTKHTNKGTDFLLCFEQNDVNELLDSAYLEIYMASYDDTATVTITCKAYPAYQRTFVLTPRKSYTYRISVDTVQYHGTARLLDTLSNLWINTSEVPDPRVVRVVSTNPIVCYGMNHKYATSDGFTALPRQTAGTEYRIMSYYNSGRNDQVSARPSQFCIAAFEDQTSITVIPSVVTVSGVAAGTPIHAILNAGDGFQVQTDATILGGDLTGSIVTSSKPVAVYGSHARAEVPVGYIRPLDGGTSRNCLAEALPPVGTWGKNFVLSSFTVDDQGSRRPEGDVMRVLALNDNTTVKVNGQQWGAPLAKNTFRDSLITGDIVLEASDPVLVGEYAHTSSTGLDEGDPFFAVVPPTDQTFNDFTFFASTDPTFSIQHVIIATDRAGKTSNTPGKSSIRVDNANFLPSSVFTDLPVTAGGRQFSIAQIKVEPGVHQLLSFQDAAHGITMLMYGLGIVDAYGYTGGLLLKPLRTMVILDPPVTDRPHSNLITIRNILNESVYLDSVVCEVSNRPAMRNSVQLGRTLSPQYGILNVGESLVLPLSVIHETQNAALWPLEGTVTIYSHSQQWANEEPVKTKFILYPESQADVTASVSRTSDLLTNYPNPFSTFTTLHFMVPERADISIRVFDEVGREVRDIANGEYAPGPYAIRFDRRDLAPGCYSYELVSERLNIHERHAMIIGN